MPTLSNSLHADSSLREILSNAIRYWEPRRIAYNVALALVVAGWVVVTWPHFRGAWEFEDLLALLVLAVLANVCYCAAYLADIPMQYSVFQAAWRRRRWALWLVGTLFAMALAYFWIADEIYPALDYGVISRT